MSLHRHRVLIVEDEIFIAAELADTVRDAGAEVVGPAMSAPEALQLIENHAITVAILDVRLGDHDSLPVARRLFEIGIPFLFHTANEDRALSREWPQVTVVKKPAMAHVLVEAIGAAASNQ